MMSAIVSAFPLLRFAEKAMPTCENSRSTAADDGYCVRERGSRNTQAILLTFVARAER